VEFREEKTLSFKSDKPIKEVALRTVFKGHTGTAFFDNITVKEEFIFGESELYMIQKILKGISEDDRDWIDEITQLKRKMLKQVRKNKKLEKELGTIEKKIALLIKNRIDVQEVLQSQKRFFKLFRSKVEFLLHHLL
jgi:Ras GTPase-activating-like protein IQGAP2/3